MLGENRPRQVELSSYDSVALLVFFVAVILVL